MAAVLAGGEDDKLFAESPESEVGAGHSAGPVAQLLWGAVSVVEPRSGGRLSPWVCPTVVGAASWLSPLWGMAGVVVRGQRADAGWLPCCAGCACLRLLLPRQLRPKRSAPGALGPKRPFPLSPPRPACHAASPAGGPERGPERAQRARHRGWHRPQRRERPW